MYAVLRDVMAGIAGDLPWHLVLDAKSQYVTASQIVQQVRECTARCMAFPLPVPAPDAAFTWASVKVGDGEPPEVQINKFADALDIGLADSVTVAGPNRTTKLTDVRDVSSLLRLDIRSVNHVVKAIPDRIYSIAFHPAEDKLIAICGGKEGRLGLWCPKFDTASNRPVKRARKELHLRDEDDHSEEDDATCTVFRPHSAPINQFYVRLRLLTTRCTRSHVRKLLVRRSRQELLTSSLQALTTGRLGLWTLTKDCAGNCSSRKTKLPFPPLTTIRRLRARNLSLVAEWRLLLGRMMERFPCWILDPAQAALPLRSKLMKEKYRLCAPWQARIVFSLRVEMGS
jgi:hypothetical protein